jgi:hypothetical protein
MAIQSTDILLDESYDLQIANGDFVIGDSEAQHVELLLMATKGDFRQHPYVGVGIRKYINAPGAGNELAREIGIQLELDGYKVGALDVSDLSNLQIDAERK